MLGTWAWEWNGADFLDSPDQLTEVTVTSPAYQLTFPRGKVGQVELCFPRHAPPIVRVLLRGHTLLYLVRVCIRTLS